MDAIDASLPPGGTRHDARIYMREINPRHAVPERDMLVRNPVLKALLADDVLDSLGKLEVELAYLLRAAVQSTGDRCDSNPPSRRRLRRRALRARRLRQPDFVALGNKYGTVGSADQCATRGAADSIPGDFITNELGKIPANSTLVTVFAGGNDTNVVLNALGCGAGGTTTASETAFITTWVTNFANDYHFLLQSTRSALRARRSSSRTCRTSR